ncbi:MAG: 4-hydroxy-tetrahydrodipicolinate reductase, partial [Clostridiales bacterium]
DSFDAVRERVDCIIDFSNHALLPKILAYALDKRLPAVIATTGHTEAERAQMREAAAHIPVFSSGNMSLGINVLISLAKSAAAALGSDFDIEIVEMHHNRKLDAPSGTALMIADGIREALPYEPEYIYDRTQRRAPRGRSEIGIHSIRGGTIVGEHEVIFSGRGEVIRISHSAQGRELFAQGALAAAEYIKNKQNGLYSMKELLMDSAVGMK